MSYSKTRIAMVACGLAVVWLGWPLQSQGGLFDWMCPSSWTAPTASATTYAAPYTARRVVFMPMFSPVSTMSAPVGQTCYYAPQTRYRWSYSRMSYTTYRPVTTLDPCTGCAATAYQPVTQKTLLPWLHQEPYTAYRMTCYNNACATGCAPACYSGCPTSCSPCGVPGTFQTVAGSSCGTGCAPITTVPGSSYDPGYSTPQTFKSERPVDSDESTGEETEELKPRPDPNSGPASLQRLRLIRPDNQTASRPVQYATYRHSAARATSPSGDSQAALDVGGWRAWRE
jgi:hypothetical protein